MGQRLAARTALAQPHSSPHCIHTHSHASMLFIVLARGHTTPTPSHTLCLILPSLRHPPSSVISTLITILTFTQITFPLLSLSTPPFPPPPHPHTGHTSHIDCRLQTGSRTLPPFIIVFSLISFLLHIHTHAHAATHTQQQHSMHTHRRCVSICGICYIRV